MAAFQGLSMLSMPRARLMLMARAPPAVPISVPRPPKAQSAHLTNPEMGTFQRAQQYQPLLGHERVTTVMELLDLLAIGSQHLQ